MKKQLLPTGYTKNGITANQEEKKEMVKKGETKPEENGREQEQQNTPGWGIRERYERETEEE
jgi:hypothetical protein